MTPREQFEQEYRAPREGRTLIVGSRLYKDRPDRRALYAQAIGVDMQAGAGVDLVLNLEDDLPAGLGTFEHIECISVLEHSRRPWLVAANIERLMTPGATIDLSVPFVWSLHSYPCDLFRFTAGGVRELFPGIDWLALLYAHERLADSGKTPRKSIDGHIYIARTEVLGWGIREG